MGQILKCPKVTVILSYWEALGEVSKLRCNEFTLFQFQTIILYLCICVFVLFNSGFGSMPTNPLNPTQMYQNIFLYLGICCVSGVGSIPIRLLK